MIIDSSAVCAILFGEPDTRRYEEAIASADVRRMSAGNLLEAAILVESRSGPLGGDQLDALIERAAIEVVPVTAEQITAARRAWRRFGRGRHRAALNMGDCIAYALAEATREPLLFKGDDFALTDVEAA